MWHASHRPRLCGIGDLADLLDLARVQVVRKRTERDRTEAFRRQPPLELWQALHIIGLPARAAAVGLDELVAVLALRLGHQLLPLAAREEHRALRIGAEVSANCRRPYSVAMTSPLTPAGSGVASV